MSRNRGFTLIELLITIAIIGILGSIVVISVSSSRQKAYFNRSLAEFKSMNNALELYKSDHEGAYPPDANRNVMPLGLDSYMPGGAWPAAPWPDSFYDWDNWVDPVDSSLEIHQISIRFCHSVSGEPVCNFPNVDWTEDFGFNSALYYCVEGICRSHYSLPVDYPGYCVNCQN